MRAKRFASAAMVIGALLLVVGGCAGDNTVAPAKRETPTARSAAAGTALRDPDSAASTAVRFWQYVAVGALPAAWSLYDPAVLNELGAGSFGGMLASQQSVAAGTALNVVDVETVAGGSLVLAELIPGVGPKTRASFFLKRRNGRWQIVYDTFSANALWAFVQQREQRRIEPTAKQPSGRALEAADEAAARFRAVALGTGG